MNRAQQMFGILLSAMPVAERMLLVQLTATVLILLHPTAHEPALSEEERAAEAA
jgi:hypothetical protein